MRWGAASVTWRGQLVVIGGYGGAGTHARRSDVLIGRLMSDSSSVAALTTGTASDSTTAACGDGVDAGISTAASTTVAMEWRFLQPPPDNTRLPAPRMCHTASLIGKSVFGNLFSNNISTIRIVISRLHVDY
jgi:hypothetical protein